MRRVSRDSPARGDTFNDRLGRLRVLRLELCDRLCPHHAEGAQLRDLKEVVGAGGKDKENLRANFVDVEPALAEFEKILNPGGKGKGELLDDGTARLRKRAGADREVSQPRRLAAKFQNLGGIDEKILRSARTCAFQQKVAKRVKIDRAGNR